MSRSEADQRTGLGAARAMCADDRFVSCERGGHKNPQLRNARSMSRATQVESAEFILQDPVD